MPHMTCLWCGDDFTPKRRTARFCSRSCGEKHRYHRDAEVRRRQKEANRRGYDPVAQRRRHERWAARHPDYQAEPAATAKRRAWDRVNTELRAGRLERGPCELADGDCLGRIEAHHDDYSQPLAVRWLCTRHHRRAHAGAD